MAHEVIVGQQVDKEKEAKEKTKRLVITLGAIGILIFGWMFRRGLNLLQR